MQERITLSHLVNALSDNLQNEESFSQVIMYNPQ